MTSIASVITNNYPKDKINSSIKKLHQELQWAEYDAAAIEKVKDKTSVTFFAILNNNIIGYVTASVKKIIKEPALYDDFQDYDDNKNYELFFLAVHPNHQRGGIGRKLIENVFKEVKERGGNRISLLFHNTEKLNKFYSSLPYEKTIRDRGHYPNTFPRREAIYTL